MAWKRQSVFADKIALVARDNLHFLWIALTPMVLEKAYSLARVTPRQSPQEEIRHLL